MRQLWRCGPAESLALNISGTSFYMRFTTTAPTTCQAVAVLLLMQSRRFQAISPPGHQSGHPRNLKLDVLVQILAKQRELGVDHIAGTTDMMGPSEGPGRGRGRGRGRGEGRGRGGGCST